jgi:hypothetical protein
MVQLFCEETMASYYYVVLTSAKPGRLEEFDRWYDEQHIPDVVNVPGVKSAKRFRLINAVENHEPVDSPWNSLALYEFDTDDPLALAKQLSTMAGSDAMPMTDSIDDVRIKIIGTFAKEA